MEVIGSAEMGLVILDNNYILRVWNLFMVQHSGLSAESVMGKNIFKLFPDISSDWFIDKVQQIQSRKTKLLSTWEERPYLFKFVNNRRQFSSAAYMYQNITLIPLASASGEIENFAITISDVTDIAASTQKLDAVVSEYSQYTYKKN